MHGTARHPRTQVRDPPRYRLSRQSAGKLPADLPRGAAGGERAEFFGTRAVRETGKELGVFSKSLWTSELLRANWCVSEEVTKRRKINLQSRGCQEGFVFLASELA